jgi:hypothetical protein
VYRVDRDEHGKKIMFTIMGGSFSARRMAEIKHSASIVFVYMLLLAGIVFIGIVILFVISVVFG